MGHAGKLKNRFSKVVAGASTGGGVVAVAGMVTTVIILSPEALGVLALSPLLIVPGCIFWGHRALSGSATPSPGVPSALGSCLPTKKYNCCRDQEGGCIDVCNNCKQKWGEEIPMEKPCIFIQEQEKIKQKGIEYIVFPKSHTLVDVQTVWDIYDIGPDQPTDNGLSTYCNSFYLLSIVYRKDQ